MAIPSAAETDVEEWPTPKDFVAVCLMAHVPNQLIVGGVEYVVKSHSEFNYAETGTKMATVHADAVYNELSQFITYLLQLHFVQFAEVFRCFDPTK
jgi:hypothetical protein